MEIHHTIVYLKQIYFYPVRLCVRLCTFKNELSKILNWHQCHTCFKIWKQWINCKSMTHLHIWCRNVHIFSRIGIIPKKNYNSNILIVFCFFIQTPMHVHCQILRDRWFKNLNFADIFITNQIEDLTRCYFKGTLTHLKEKETTKTE